MTSFIARSWNIHRNGVLTALAWLVPHGTAAVSAQVLCTPYNHAPCHFMQSHIRKVYACLAAGSKHMKLKDSRFIRTKHIMQIFGVIPFSWAQLTSKIISGLTLHLTSYCFSVFNCCHRLYRVSFCRLIKGITPRMCMLCFVLINSIILNLLCVWIRF